MERAEEATVAVTSDEAAPPIPRVKKLPGVTTYVALANLVLLGALVWSNSGISRRLDDGSALASKQVEATEELKRDIATIAVKNADLEREIGELREAVSSRTTEDILFLKIIITKRDIDRRLARDIARLVQKYARIYGQDPDLVLAMIAVESDFDPTARSTAGAVGLMQVMPQWRQVLGINEDLTDSETSIKYGLQILGFYRNMYGELEMALTAYNRGPGPVDAALNKGMSPHNKYAPRVIETYNELRSLDVDKEIG
jgi:hypothetical protein